MLLDIKFFKFDDNMCLTPYMAKKIIGDPSRIITHTPCGEFSDEFRVIYLYTTDKYDTQIIFPSNNTPYTFKEVCDKNGKEDTTKIAEILSSIKLFSIHKEYCASLIRIHNK